MSGSDHIRAPPIHRSEFQPRYPPCSDALLRRSANTVGNRSRNRYADRPTQRLVRFVDRAGIWSRGFLRGSQAGLALPAQLANYLKLQMNRYAKTSFLHLREDAFESLGDAKVVFAPTG